MEQFIIRPTFSNLNPITTTAMATKEKTAKETLPHVSRTKDETNGDILQVSLEGATIILSELRVRPSCNWSKPHLLLGRGGANILLTNNQLARVMAEFLRYTCDESLSHEQEDVSFYFLCHRKPKPE